MSSDWEKVLRNLHDNEGRIFFESDIEMKGLDRQEYQRIQKRRLRREVSEQLNLDATENKELNDLFFHLNNVGLISKNQGTDWAEIILEEKGFNVAHERELERGRATGNAMLVVLTAALVFGSLLQAMAAALTVSPAQRDEIILVMVILLGLLVMITFVTYLNYR